MFNSVRWIICSSAHFCYFTYVRHKRKYLYFLQVCNSLHIRNTYIKIWRYIYIYKFLGANVQIIIFCTQSHSLSLSCNPHFSPFFRILWKVRLQLLHKILGIVTLLNCKILHYIHRSCLLKLLPIRRVFGCIIKTAKSDCQRRQVCLSVRPHGKTRLPLDGSH